LATKIIKIFIRAYLCKFNCDSEFNSEFNESVIERKLIDVNRIWQSAGIEWELSSVEMLDVSALDINTFCYKDSKHLLRDSLVNVSPEIPEVLATRLWKVCFLRQFPASAGGVYLPETQTVFFSENNRKGNNSPAILAHELGHSLGLIHCSDSGNLMNPEALKNIHSLLNTKNNDALMFFTAEQIRSVNIQAGSGPKKLAKAGLAYNS